MRRMRLGPVLGSVLGSVLLILTACGGDSGDDAAVEDTTTTAAAQDDAESAETTTTASETTTTAEVTGDGDSAWCRGVRDVQESGAPSPIDFNFFGRSPEQLEEQMKTNLETFEMWADLAPPEIQADVDFFVGAFGQFVDLGDEAGWDVNTIASDPAFLEVFESADLESAASNIDAYTSGVCEVSFGAAPPTTAPAGDSGDLMTDILAAIGLPPGFLPEDARTCLSAELADDYPDGIGSDFVLDQATIDVLDEATAACGIDIGL